MLKFLVFALLAWAIWYAFTYRRPGDWPPGDDRGDDKDPGPVLPASQIGHDPASKTPESVDENS